jgi:hypothetical protein
MNRRALAAIAAAATISLAGSATAQTQATPPVGPDWSKIEIKPPISATRPICWRGKAAISPSRSPMTA